jgi:hypothetical protein
MTNAQDQYKRMLRDEIAPALRLLGMKGSGGNFVLPDPDHYLLVGFQGSHYSTAESVRFTVNLAVISKDAWERGWQPWWGKPSATAHGPVGKYMRLGELMPEHDDVWWHLAPGTRTNRSAGPRPEQPPSGPGRKWLTAGGMILIVVGAVTLALGLASL